MPCTNCARIWQETGVRPDHYNQGNISTCPEVHHRNCSCVRCRRTRFAVRPRQPPVPLPAPRPAPAPAPVPAPRPAPAPAPVPDPRQVLRFVSPTSSTPRCTELTSECPVCLVDFDESVASVNTSCGHKMCVGCFTTMLVSNLRQAFSKKTECPLCRTTIVQQAGL